MFGELPEQFGPPSDDPGPLGKPGPSGEPIDPALAAEHQAEIQRLERKYGNLAPTLVPPPPLPERYINRKWRDLCPPHKGGCDLCGHEILPGEQRYCSREFDGELHVACLETAAYRLVKLGPPEDWWYLDGHTEILLNEFNRYDEFVRLYFASRALQLIAILVTLLWLGGITYLLFN